MQTLSGRTCVFAGATAGDGPDIVKALCLGGMNVAMMTHNPERAMDLIGQVIAMEAPGRCLAIGAMEDGSPAEFDAKTYEKLQEQFGSVDVVICNTGDNGDVKPLEEITDRDLTWEFDHVVKNSFRMAQTALPYLKKSESGRIILMTSAEARRGGTRGSLANAVAKGAVMSLALNLAARLAPLGITVNCISKGAIPRVEGIRPGTVDPEEYLPDIPMKRLGTSKDLASAVCFFASEESAYITGQVLSVSGGMEIG